MTFFVAVAPQQIRSPVVLRLQTDEYQANLIVYGVFSATFLCYECISKVLVVSKEML